jgi:hypothetical protein
MNERLLELAKQTGLKKDHGSDREYTGDFNWREFAELIVKECIKESWDEIVSDEDIAQEKDPLIQEYLKGNNQGIVDAVIRFRNHFGVEQ